MTPQVLDVSAGSRMMWFTPDDERALGIAAAGVQKPNGLCLLRNENEKSPHY